MTVGNRTGRKSLTLEGFDGIRALAACSVLTYHVALWSKFKPAGALAPLFWELKGGVTVFFVISGALLYLPYARAIRDRQATPDWRGYARRRVLRILPAYWVALTVFVVGPFGTGVVGLDLWRYYGLSQIYQPKTVFTGLGVAWSLCVEVSFYAILPMFAALAARLVRSRSERGAARVQFGLIAAMAIVSLGLRGIVAGSLTAPTIHGGTTMMVSLPGLFDWFAIGMALAVLRAELEAGRAADRAIARLGRRPVRCAVLCCSLFLAAMPFQHGDIFLPWYGLVTHVAMGLGSGALVLAAIVPAQEAGKSLILRVLRHPRVVWVGVISYGIYLWHLPVLLLIGPHLSTDPGSAPLGDVMLAWLLVLAGGILMGAASWYLVERPFQRVFGRRHRTAKGAGATEQSAEIDAAVQAYVDPLNPTGVAVDHLA
ncbi:MAG TPA: acyltransferase [Solirubrobacteraceae bacterium]|nr:acyltransferase [Solirubrobacteraceae bacterium]